MFGMYNMVSEAKTKINEVNGRHTIYLRKSLVKDSAFPFEVGEPLTVRIITNKVVIERYEK